MLPKIERAAASRFASYGLAEVMGGVLFAYELLEERQEAGQLWVAVDREDSDSAVGFAAASILDGFGHLEELDVLPAHGRSGVGSRLLEAVEAWARKEGHAGLTLSTMREIPWNAPFYRRRGFVELGPTDLTPSLERIRGREADAGLPVALRVLMQKRF